MATRKEVDLVIRARDQAKGVVNSITDALSDFQGVQKKLQSEAGETDSVLGELGKSFRDLQKALGGSRSADKLAAQMDGAAAAVGRLEGGLRDAEGAAIGYQRELSAAQRRTKELREESDYLKRALDAEKTALKGAEAAHKANGLALRGAYAEFDSLTKRYDRLGTSLERQKTRVTESAQRVRDLQLALAQAEKPTVKMQTALEKAQSAAYTARARFRELTEQQFETAAALELVVARAESLETNFEGSTAAVAEHKAAVDRLEPSYKAISAALKVSEKDLDSLAGNADKAAKALDATTRQLADARTEYARLGEDATAAGAAFDKLSQKARGSLLVALKEQEKVLASLSGEYAEAREESTRLGREIAKTRAPSRQMTDEFERARQATIRLNAAVERQREGIHRMRQALAESVGDVDQIINRQERFRGALSATTEALAKQQAGIQEVRVAQAAAAAEAAATRRAENAPAIRTPEIAPGASYYKTATQVAKLRAELSNTTAVADSLHAEIEKPFKNIFAPTRVEVEGLEATLKSLGVEARHLGEFTSLEQALDHQRQKSALLRTEIERLLAQLRQLGAAGPTLNTRALAQGMAQTATETRQATKEVTGFQAAWRAFYGDSRTALSYMQRLRSEVLALIATYGGFFAAIQGVQATVEAFKTLEAAQSRLNVIVDSDQGRVAKELDFIRRNANRLGIEFGTLSDQYTKFAVAAKGTNLEGRETRRIFISVAEAARVNKIDNENLKGVFTALTQIVSKGAVQMEELRQQLGDRLPGAIQILADALGVTTAELTKMVENGEVGAESLSKFADELDRRFGSALSAALDGTTTALGRFQNAAFQAFARLGTGGGFIDSFTDLVNQMAATMQSAEFVSFLDRVSAGLAGLADGINYLVVNFRGVATVVSGLVALKLAPFFVAAATAVRTLDLSMTGARVRMISFTAGLGAMVGQVLAVRTAAGAAAIAFRGLRVAISAVFSATGIGLILTVVGAALGSWVTAADEATEALLEHKRVLDQVKNAYDEAKGSVEDWRDAVKDLSVTEITGRLNDLKERFADLQRELSNLSNFRNARFMSGLLAPVAEIVSRFEDGAISARTARRELDEYFQNLREQQGTVRGAEAVVGRYAKRFDELFKRLVDVQEPMEEMGLVLEAMTEDGETAAQALRELSGEVEAVGDAAEEEAKRVEGFRSALAEMAKLVPELKSKMEDLNDRQALDDAYAAAKKLASGWQEINEATETYKAALDEINAREAERVQRGIGGPFDNGRDAAASLIRKEEGFRSQAYWDVNHFRVGFGSDTYVNELGKVNETLESTRVTIEQANLDLYRRIDEYMAYLREKIGSERFNAMTPEQQAALTSIVYNYGKLPASLTRAIRDGMSDSDIAAAIRNLSSNPERRDREAALFQSVPKLDVGAPEKYEAWEVIGRTSEGRRVVVNPNGGLSTEITETVGVDGGFVNIPTLYQGRPITHDEMLERIVEAGWTDPETGREVKVYATESEAVAAAQARTSALANDPGFQAAERRRNLGDRSYADRDKLALQQEQELRQQELIAAGRERQAKIEEALFDARQKVISLSEEEVASISEGAARLYDLEQQAKQAKLDGKTEETISALDAEIEKQKLLNAGLETEAEVRDAIEKAVADNPNITGEQIQAIKARVTSLQDLKAAKEAAEKAGATEETIADLEFQIQQQGRINAGKEREAEIEAAIRDARRENNALTADQEARIRANTAALYDAQRAEELANAPKKAAEEAEQKVNDLLALRKNLLEELTFQIQRGTEPGVVDGLTSAIAGVNAQLDDAIGKAIQLFEALGSSDPAVAGVISRLRLLKLTSDDAAQGVVISWEQVSQTFASNVVSAVDSFVSGLAEGKSAAQSLRDAFLQFAADFLRQIAQMILQQIVFNAVQAAGKSFGLVAHQGAVVGQRPAGRQISTSIFSGAQRYHGGGLPGLGPKEVPAILERGEEVIPETDPRHRFNLGKGSGAQPRSSIHIANYLDPAEVLEAAFSDPSNDSVIVNVIRRNRRKIRQELS